MTRIGLRNVWLQIHKWIGLILAILIIPLSVTGAALVWHQALDRMLSPDRYAVTRGSTLPADRFAAAARRAFPKGSPIASIRMPVAAGDPVIAMSGALPTRVQGPSPRINVYLDPATARVLEVSNSRSGPVMVLHMIHGTFMVPGIGRQMVGWTGVAMMISCLSGLWLWWPTTGRWIRGLRWRRHRDFDANLHHLFGFWIAMPMFILSFTGAWISFPAFFGPLVGENGRPMGFSATRMAMVRAKPLLETGMSFDQAEAQALAKVPGAITQVVWPTDYQAAWLFSIKPAAGTPALVAVDDASGTASIAPDPDRGQADTARLMRRIHDGTGMGIAWQFVIFLGGLLPAVLAITGIIMWWRARRWRRKLKTRQRLRNQ